jgi:hypothetical protein
VRNVTSAIRRSLPRSTLRARGCRNAPTTTSALAVGMRILQTVRYPAFTTYVNNVDTCSAIIHIYFPFLTSCYLPFK